MVARLRLQPPISLWKSAPKTFAVWRATSSFQTIDQDIAEKWIADKDKREPCGPSRAKEAATRCRVYLPCGW